MLSSMAKLHYNKAGLGHVFYVAFTTIPRILAALGPQFSHSRLCA